jgi:parallel beta-helix repeat protein
MFEDKILLITGRTGSYGICLYECNHSSSQNIYAYDNYRHGMHPGSDTTGRNMYNTYRDIYAWDNGVNGFDDRGSITPYEQLNNVYDNIQCWDNGELGIVIGLQKGGVLSNSSACGNGVNGHGDEYGIFLYGLGNFDVTNVIVKNNYSGIALDTCSDITLTSCQSYDDQGTTTQDYGVSLGGTNTGISLLNCKLSPNQYGDIYNPNSVAVTVITEKMLAKF